MSDQITIHDCTFNVPLPYAEGHSLNAREAEVLNSAFHGALRNNFAPKVKKAKEAGTANQDELQRQLDDYAAHYQFGGRRNGKAEADPAAPVALNMARDVIRKAAKERGKEMSADLVTKTAKQLLERQGPDGAIMTAARQRVENERTASQSAYDEVRGLIDAS